MASSCPTLTALHVLHYLTPIATAAYFVTARTISSCLLQKPSKKANTNHRRYSAIGLLVAIVATYTIQGILHISRTLVQHGWWASQDDVVYILASILIDGSIAVGLLDSKRPIWSPYLGAWWTSFLLEVPTLCLEAVTHPRANDFRNAALAIGVVRVCGLLALVISGSWYALHERQQLRAVSDETEPLLANGANGNVTKPTTAATYGTTDDDDDTEFDTDSESDELDRDKETKQQQRKRLEQSGNWINYLKDFKIFIPMLWPFGQRFVQACIALIGLVLLSERFLTVLVPRQLGIITDQLTANAGSGLIPWQALGTWAVLAYLNSPAGIHLIQQFAELPVQQFSYKSIGSTAFRHIMTLSMDFHNDKNSGELIRAIDQGQNLHGLLEFACFHVGPMFIDLIVAFVVVYFLFDIYMTFILMVVGVAYIWVGAKTTTWSIKRRRRFNDAWRKESRVQNESISNWQTVSHFNRGQYECDQYGKTIDEFNRAELSYFFAYYMGGGVQSLIMILGRLAASFLAVYRVSQGTVPVGNFVTLISYWRSIEGPLAQVSWSIRRVSQMLTDSERLLQLLLTKPTVNDAPEADELDIEEGRVEFDHVDFAYDERKPTLRDVSFTARPGQTVALVGETGGGKSTTLKLLYRYYDVAKGAIRIDGRDIRDVTLDSLRDSFGMVPQDPSLFNITIMENIRYARLEATDDEVMEACKAAAIHDKIISFPDQYKSKVGERGVKLSGGELQRVSIARAILRQPKIVLLDEATSMIDAETEALIQTALRKLTAGRTTFVVAHRLSTIQHADLILVINDGQIIEQGTHDELIKQKGKYVALWSKQLSKDVQEAGKILAVDERDEALIDLDEDDVSPGHDPHLEQGCESDDDSASTQVDGSCQSKPVKVGKGKKLRRKLSDAKVSIRAKQDQKDDETADADTEAEKPAKLRTVEPKPTYSSPSRHDGTNDDDDGDAKGKDETGNGGNA